MGHPTEGLFPNFCKSGHPTEAAAEEDLFDGGVGDGVDDGELLVEEDNEDVVSLVLLLTLFDFDGIAGTVFEEGWSFVVDSFGGAMTLVAGATAADGGVALLK